MLSALAKLGSTSIVGQFTLGLAISAPVFMFSNLQLRAVQATDVTAEHEFANYFSLRILSTLLGLAVIAALVPFTGDSSSVRIVILLVSLSKSLECMSDVTAGLLQREEQLKRVAISLMIRGVASVLVFTLAFAYWHSLALSIVAMNGVWLGVLLFYDVPNVRRLIGRDAPFFRFQRRALGRLAILGLPLGTVATLSSLNTNIPRYFLQHYLGLADQGVFASLAYMVVAINLVVNALCQSVTTPLARLFAEGKFRQFVLLLTKLSMFGVLIGVVGAPLSLLVGRPLLTLIYRPEYGRHADLLALLVAVMALQSIGSFLVGGLTAAREFRAQFPVYILAVVVAIAGSAILVPRFGLMGAGAALFLSMLTVTLGCLWVLRTILHSQPQLAAEQQ
jgi:O-antigen/teichoic acid export membrane protein